MIAEPQEELEVIPATRSPHGYLASFISDNIAMKEGGGLIIVGCPIARTGWQKYAVRDLPQQRAQDLGVDTTNPEASIDLYRPIEEVFHPEFLASLNGCPITDGHPPNGEFVDPKNYNKYAMGHIQNVRKGLEEMEDGEWPVIADLHIDAEPLIGKVLSKVAREISLGYDFSIDRDGEKIIQCSMLGNHNAVVPKGRAGDLVRIEDAAPEAVVDPSLELNPAPVVEVIEAIAYPPIEFSFSKKEKQPVAEKNQSVVPSWIRSWMGKHLIEKARATDADPEKIMDEVESMHEHAQALQPVRARATDDAEPPKDTDKNEFKSESEDKAKDGEEVAMSEDSKKVADAFARAKDSKSKGGKAHDANVAALKTLLDEFLTEEEKEPEHAEDSPVADTSELEALLSGEEKAKDCEECGGKAHDGECPGLEEVESGEEVMDEEGESPDPDSDDNKEDVEPSEDAKATDRARAADGAMATLRMLRPHVARSSDASVRNAFNKALDAVKKTSRPSTGGYGKFAGAARARDKAPRNPNPDRTRTGDGAAPDRNTALQAFYDSARKGGK